MEELHKCPLFHIGTKGDDDDNDKLARGEINTWMLEITILVCLKIQLGSTKCQTD
jgi:hypothetical protein